MTLKEVKVGRSVIVKKLIGQGATKRRIMDNLCEKSCAFR